MHLLKEINHNKEDSTEKIVSNDKQNQIKLNDPYNKRDRGEAIETSQKSSYVANNKRNHDEAVKDGQKARRELLTNTNNNKINKILFINQNLHNKYETFIFCILRLIL